MLARCERNLSIKKISRKLWKWGANGDPKLGRKAQDNAAGGKLPEVSICHKSGRNETEASLTAPYNRYDLPLLSFQ